MLHKFSQPQQPNILSPIQSQHQQMLQVHKKSKFTPDEDAKLYELVNRFGINDWNKISGLMAGRNTRQCRERWRHYLSPEVSTEPFTEDEDMLLQQKYGEFGHQWKKIASFFPNRTDITVKNRWLFLHRQFERNLKLFNSNSNNNISNCIHDSYGNCLSSTTTSPPPPPQTMIASPSSNSFNIKISNVGFNITYNNNSNSNGCSCLNNSAPTIPCNSANQNSSNSTFDDWAEDISNIAWDEYVGYVPAADVQGERYYRYF